jgi:hypothetical protein
LAERQERDIENCPNAQRIIQQRIKEEQKKNKIAGQKKLQEDEERKQFAIKKQAFDTCMHRNSKRQKNENLSTTCIIK